MKLCSVGNLERFYVHPNNAPHERHWIDIAMGTDAPTFAVTSCCDDEWIWEFWYDKTSYDLVKHVVMDCIFECDDMDELIDALDEVFEENFEEIVVDEEFQEDEIQCDGDCDNCEFN